MKTIVAIVSIAIVIFAALMVGINGVVLTAGVAAIAGLGGYSARRLKDK